MDSKYSKYELVSPDWLNEEFFEIVLRQYNNDNNIKVSSLKITPGTFSNDHYGSCMYRATIEYNFKGKSNIISLIAKVMPEEDSAKKDMLSKTFIFRTEIRMYSEAIPRMEAELRKYGDNTVLGAKLLYSALEPHQVLVFEDLVEKGFAVMKNRLPTEEESSRAMFKLAKWHAVSYKLAQEEPALITSLNESSFNFDIDNMEMFTTGVRYFINHVLSTNDELKQYIPYFENFDKTKIQSCKNLVNAFRRGDKAIFVLNHGDFHTKNMMFKHKATGEFEDLMLVDFQTSFYGPAAFDVLFSIYMLWDRETRYNKRDEMIHYYFSNFIDTLEKIEFKGELPKMADFQIYLINYRFFELFLLTTFVPVIAAFADDSLDLDKISESSDYRQKLFQLPAFISEVERTLPKYLLKGYLDSRVIKDKAS